MIDGKFTILSDELAEELGTTAAIIAAKVYAFCGSDSDECQISREYLCRICNCTTPTLLAAISKLQLCGYVLYSSGRGRGKKSVFKKGKKFYLLYDEKGKKNTSKKVKNQHTKSIDNSIGGSAPACACDSTPFQKRVKKMDDFNKFWQLFKVAPEYESTYDDAARQWSVLTPATQAAIINELQQGKRNNKERKPYWYLHNWRPELPLFYNGELALAEAMREVERAYRDGTPHEPLVMVWYGNKPAYCWQSNLNRVLAAGATMNK